MAKDFAVGTELTAVLGPDILLPDGGALHWSVMFVPNRNDGTGVMAVGEKDAAFLIGL